MRPTTLALLSLSLSISLSACGGSSKSTTTTTPATKEPATTKLLVNVDDAGVALERHDPVSYTAAGGPALGSVDHASTHGGATYHFATAEQRTAFDADAAKYVPAYGGFCAFAASQNRLSPADPTVFVMHQGQLLVFTDQSFRDSFNQAPDDNRRKADANWPGLVERHGR